MGKIGRRQSLALLCQFAPERRTVVQRTRAGGAEAAEGGFGGAEFGDTVPGRLFREGMSEILKGKVRSPSRHRVITDINLSPRRQVAVDEIPQRLAGSRIDPAIDTVRDDVLEAGRCEIGGIGEITCMKREIGNPGSCRQPSRVGDVLRHHVDAKKASRMGGGQDRGRGPLTATQFAPTEPSPPSGRSTADNNATRSTTREPR